MLVAIALYFFCLPMRSDSSSAVLILARGGSKGIPLKNLQLVGGVSLLTRAIQTAKLSGVNDVTVSTDHPLIALESIKSGANIFLRSQVTASDQAPSIWGSQEFLANRPDIDVLVLLQVTSPFTHPNSLRKALDKIEKPIAFDCIFSVTRNFKLRWVEVDNRVQPINFKTFNRPRRQDWNGELYETGAFYISKRKLIEKGYFQNNNCHGCTNSLVESKFLKCMRCASEYCYECLNLSSESIKKLNKDQLTNLSCPYCQNVTKRKNNDSTPCRQRRNNSQNDTSIFGTNNPSGSELKNEPVTMESISRLFDIKLSPDSSIMSNLRSALKKDIEKMVSVEVARAVEKLKDDFTATTDYISEEQKDLNSKICEKDNRIKQLEAEVQTSKACLQTLQVRVFTMEKISRNLNLEIHEIPESKNENLMALFDRLCQCLKIDVGDNNIRVCRRVAKMKPSSKRPRNILVTLSSQRLRDLITSAVTRFNKAHPNDRLATTHIGLTGETNRIYVSEHLSPEAKELHSAARKFCKLNNFKFVWVRFGEIYVRRNEQCPAIHIKSLDSLTRIQ